MAFNPLKLLKFKEMLNLFEERHPKFVAFIDRQVVKGDLPEGTVIQITVARPGEEPVTTNMRVTAEDVAAIQTLKDEAQPDKDHNTENDKENNVLKSITSLFDRKSDRT